eukprot:m.451954 g.451954  ORF g.451954 m.451954 type:complete len:107 (-) comp20325_c3_seq27:803-1123(-)
MAKPGKAKGRKTNPLVVVAQTRHWPSACVAPKQLSKLTHPLFLSFHQQNANSTTSNTTLTTDHNLKQTQQHRKRQLRSNHRISDQTRVQNQDAAKANANDVDGRKP